MPHSTGSDVTKEQAWDMLRDWKSRRIDISYLFAGASGLVMGLGKIHGVRTAMIEMRGEVGVAWFHLGKAEFQYGPVEVYPRWPAPPPVQVIALQASLPDGGWLVMAEGVLPPALAATMLPQ